MDNNKNICSDEPLGPRSQLLEKFIDHIELEGTSYAIMNNYEGLPRIIPSDIDFTINLELFCRLDDFIWEFARSNQALVVQKIWHGNQKCAYILGTGMNNAQEFIQLDFFVAFSIKGCPFLLSHDELIDGFKRFGKFRVPSPSTELVFIAMRRLFKDDWSERHCSRIAELKSNVLSDNWLLPKYAWLEPTLLAAAKGDLKGVNERRAEDWSNLCRKSSKNIGILGRISNVVLQTKRIAVRLRDETGHLAAVVELSTVIDGSQLDSLELVFHRRYHIDERVLSSMSNLNRVLLPIRLALLKRRKGLVLLHIGSGDPLTRRLLAQLKVLRMVDQVLVENSVNTNLEGISVISTVDVITAIVNRQAEKTAYGRVRAGTQTSG